MKEPRFIPIYCASTAKKDAPYVLSHRDRLGRCFAERKDGRWQCCCCGRRVAVTW